MNLLATHYCPQGNQPRLRMSADSTTAKINFEFQDATNLSSLDSNHQHSLSLALPSDKSDFTRSESYLSKEGEEQSYLVLERVIN